MASLTPMLGAGTTFSVDLLADDVFVQINGLKGLPEIGQKGSFIDVTALDEIVKSFIGGLKEGAELALQFNDLPGDADQLAFLVLMDGTVNIECEVVLPNGRSGKFFMAPAGYAIDPPDAEGAIMLTTSGKQSGAVIWTIT